MAACLFPSERKRRCDRCFAARQGGGARGGARSGGGAIGIGGGVHCSRCGLAYYCSEACMAADATQHGRQCAALADASAQLRALEATAGRGTLGRFGAALLAGRCATARTL